MKFVFWFVRFLARGVTNVIPLRAMLAIRNFIFQMLKVRPMKKTNHTSQYFNPVRVNIPDYTDSSQLILKDKHLQLQVMHVAV